LWIAQAKQPDDLFKKDFRWFVFIETVNQSGDTGQSEYRIDGMVVVLKETLKMDMSEQNKHFGVYYSNTSTENLNENRFN